MKNKNLVGLLFFSCCFFAGFWINDNLALYFNISGLLIVFSGTAAAALLSFKVEQLKIVYKVMTASYRRPIKDEADVINILIDLSIKSRIRQRNNN
jgi:chemotaxis protein MotA